jgi:hypothetical protein
LSARKFKSRVVSVLEMSREGLHKSKSSYVLEENEPREMEVFEIVSKHLAK